MVSLVAALFSSHSNTYCVYTKGGLPARSLAESAASAALPSPTPAPTPDSSPKSEPNFSKLFLTPFSVQLLLIA
ncbi:MAG: hypothetical protein OJF52_000780 [Nitrospira sp.]|nr:MAG: hypothetical protein OJF52_000780 [Nitrospira sp.]